MTDRRGEIDGRSTVRRSPWGRLAVALLLAAPASGQLWPAGDRLWRQGDADPGGTIAGTPEADDRFGGALAAGDFDHDGHLDLAIGVPGEGTVAEPRHGVVQVLYGGTSGLTGSGNQLFDLGTPGIPGNPQGGDELGSALAVGRFDDDLFDDLAIGVPGRVVDGEESAGAVVVLYGGAAGLVTAGAQLWHQNSPGVPGEAAAADGFGAALAAGDFDGDGIDDLAVGAPIVGALFGHVGGGEVQIFDGGPGGLDGGGTLWDQDDPVFGAEEIQARDGFGRSLAAGDFAADGVDDLAIGVPGEDDEAASIDDHGIVHVLEFSPGSPASAQLWHQGTAGVAGAREAGDQFGAALAAGDFDGDGAADLAVGVPTEDLTNADDAGAVNVLYGADGQGLIAAGSQLWTQEATGVAGTPEAGDLFGRALAAGDLQARGRDSLVIGVPGEPDGATSETGAVAILPGSAAGLVAAGNQLYGQGSPGVLGGPEAADELGAALAVGDFDGNGHGELAVGVPGEDAAAGAVAVLRGALFADDLESGDLFYWSASAP